MSLQFGLTQALVVETAGLLREDCVEEVPSESLHRVLLFQFYLNDVAEGGETEFFYQQRRVAPKAGRLVIASR